MKGLWFKKVVDTPFYVRQKSRRFLKKNKIRISIFGTKINLFFIHLKNKLQTKLNK